MTKCSCLGDKCIENLSRSELEILLNDSIRYNYMKYVLQAMFDQRIDIPVE